MFNLINKWLDKIPVLPIIWPPRKLFKLPFAESWFYLSMRFDKSTIEHLIGGFLLGFLVGPLAAIAWGIGGEVSDGTGDDRCTVVLICKQGFDLMDLFADIIGAMPFIFWLPTLVELWNRYGIWDWITSTGVLF